MKVTSVSNALDELRACALQVNRVSFCGTAVVSSDKVQAWDVPTRVFKWLFVAVVAAAWATKKYAVEPSQWHSWCGYAALVLVIFRVLWGLCGGYTARFSTFVANPRTVARYVWTEIRGHRCHYLGHNPLGGWMTIALLGAVGAQAILGLFSSPADWLAAEGPLAHTISDPMVTIATRLHRSGINVIMFLVAVHVSANVYQDVFRRAGLIRAMITGNKPCAEYVDAAAPVSGSPWVAFVCLLAAIVTVSVILILLA